MKTLVISGLLVGLSGCATAGGSHWSTVPDEDYRAFTAEQAWAKARQDCIDAGVSHSGLDRCVNRNLDSMAASARALDDAEAAQSSGASDFARIVGGAAVLYQQQRNMAPPQPVYQAPTMTKCSTTFNPHGSLNGYGSMDTKCQ